MCHWHAFHDPHSRISYYRVGLGTEPMKSDVLQMVNVGLQEGSKTKQSIECSNGEFN